MQIGDGSPWATVRVAMLSLAVATALACSDGTETSGSGPTILLMNPSGVPTGQLEFTLAVFGKGFVPGA